MGLMLVHLQGREQEKGQIVTLWWRSQETRLAWDRKVSMHHQGCPMDVSHLWWGIMEYSASVLSIPNPHPQSDHETNLRQTQTRRPATGYPASTPQDCPGHEKGKTEKSHRAKEPKKTWWLNTYTVVSKMESGNRKRILVRKLGESQ